MPACANLPPILGTQGASGDLSKVLFCSFDVLPEPTGTSARSTAFVRGLTPVFNVDGLTVKTPDHSHIVRYHGARLMRVPVGTGDLSSRVQAFERAVRRQLESEEYQLVHFTDPHGGYALCELKAQQNYKVIYEVVGFPSIELKYTHPHLEGDRRFLARLRRQELYCLMNADAVLVGSRVTAAMVEGLGVSRERIHVIPPAVELSDYPAVPRAREEGAPLRVIYVGGQQSWQGLSTLLFALSAAARTVDVRLSIVGPSNHEWRLQLEEMIRYRNLSERVEFVDPVPESELHRLLAAADVGVAPLEKSERNTQQGAPIMKLANYLASGLPVIASDLPVVRELLSDEVALFHRPGDERGLAERMIELAADPERRRRMGHRARALAIERLGTLSAQRRLREIYAALMGIEVPEPSDLPETAGVPDDDAPTSMVSLDDPALAQFQQQTMIQFRDAAQQRGAHTQPFARLSAPRTSSNASLDPAERLKAAAQVFSSSERPSIRPPGAPVRGGAMDTSPTIIAPAVVDGPPDTSPEFVPPVPDVPAEASDPQADTHPRLATTPTGDPSAPDTQPRIVSPSPQPGLPMENDQVEPIDVTADAEPLPPEPGEPEELSDEDIEDVTPEPPPSASAAPNQHADPTTPTSGVSPEEEWFGHLLFGYAPFGVPLARRVSTGEQPMLLPPRHRESDG